MLGYKITFFDLALNTLLDPLLLGITALVYLTLGVCFLRIKSKKSRLIILMFVILLPLGYTAPTILNTYSGWYWYGYELTDHKLHIKAWLVDEVVDLEDIEIILTNSSDWKPTLRKFGYGSSEVSMSYFKLKNGVEAIVFRHKNSENFVVINTSEEYYVIIHPEVEEFYKEIKMEK
jgi:hypothetical protein